MRSRRVLVIGARHICFPRRLDSPKCSLELKGTAQFLLQFQEDGLAGELVHKGTMSIRAYQSPNLLDAEVGLSSNSSPRVRDMAQGEYGSLVGRKVP